MVPDRRVFGGSPADEPEPIRVWSAAHCRRPIGSRPADRTRIAARRPGRAGPSGMDRRHGNAGSARGSGASARRPRGAGLRRGGLRGGRGPTRPGPPGRSTGSRSSGGRRPGCCRRRRRRPARPRGPERADSLDHGGGSSVCRGRRRSGAARGRGRPRRTIASAAERTPVTAADRPLQASRSPRAQLGTGGAERAMTVQGPMTASGLG